MRKPKLTWETIAVLDEWCLNLAIEEHIYQRRWHIVVRIAATLPQRLLIDDPKGIWIAREEDPQNVRGAWAIGRCPYNHMEDWDATMALTERYPISQDYGYDRGNTLGWHLSHWQHGPMLFVPASEGAQARRVALCKLVLYAATQEGGTHAQ